MSARLLCAMASLAVVSACSDVPDEPAYPPLREVHVCVRLGPEVEDRWVFMTRETVSDRAPSALLAKAVENVLESMGRTRQDEDLVLAAKHIRFATIPAASGAAAAADVSGVAPPARDADSGPLAKNRPTAFECRCAKARFSKERKFLGCSDGCDGSFVCEAQ